MAEWRLVLFCETCGVQLRSRQFGDELAGLAEGGSARGREFAGRFTAKDPSENNRIDEWVSRRIPRTVMLG
jgi:hypothetical protein